MSMCVWVLNSMVWQDVKVAISYEKYTKKTNSIGDSPMDGTPTIKCPIKSTHIETRSQSICIARCSHAGCARMVPRMTYQWAAHVWLRQVLQEMRALDEHVLIASLPTGKLSGRTSERVLSVVNQACGGVNRPMDCVLSVKWCRSLYRAPTEMNRSSTFRMKILGQTPRNHTRKNQ